MMMKVTASDVSTPDIRDGIKLKFEIEIKRNGESTRSKAVMVTRPNEPSSIAIGSEEGKDDIEVQLIAIRQ